MNSVSLHSQTRRPLRRAFVWALLFGAFAASAGQKILFSGRDGRQTQYHGSLNARSLFEPQAVAPKNGDGPSATDEIHALPAVVVSRKARKGDDDKDWAFQSSEESGAERVEKEILGEDEDLDDNGIKRSRVERFLDRERKNREGGGGAQRGRGSDTQERRRQDGDVELAKLQTALAGDPVGSPAGGVGEMGATASGVSGGGGVAPQAPTQAAVSGPAGLEFQRDHVARLKQSLGVAAAPGVDPFGGPSGSMSAGGGLAPGPESKAFGDGGGPRPESIGAYPGSQGLGLMDLTRPAGAPQIMTPLPRPESQPQPESRERSGPVRIRKSKRDIF